MSLGIQEIALIVIVVLLLFGGKRIPELARACRQACDEFKKAKHTIKKEAKELTEAIKEEPSEYQIKDDISNPEI